MGNTLRAGAARAPITGTGRYGLGGPGRRTAKGVHDDVFARALALSDGLQTVVFLAADARGVPAEVVGEIRAEVRRRVSTGQLAICVAGTSVSSGPDLLGEGRGCGGPYRRFFVDQAANTVARALEALEPATLYAAMADMPPGLLADAREDQADPMLVLSAMGAAHRAIATLAVLECRADVLGPQNRQVSADYLAPYHTAIEAARGGLSIALVGAVGDRTAREAGAGATLRSFDALRPVGEALSTPVLHAVAAVEPLAVERVDVARCHAEVSTASTWRGRRAWFGSLVAGSHGAIRTEVQSVRLGACQIVTVPGAPTAQAVAGVRRDMHVPFGAVVGCANGMWGLLAPPEAAPGPQAAGWPQVLSSAGWPIIRGMLPIT